MRCLETMKGSGIVTANDGQQVPVRYELSVYQHEIPAGSMEDPDAKISGLKEVRGTIDPVCFFGEVLTLEMQDRRKIKFMFTDMMGTIALNAWIG